MADQAARRRPAVLAALVVVGAAASAWAASLTWWTQLHLDALSGVITTRASGSETNSLLIPVALVALAGFGAALATSGTLRRVVGALLLIGGGSAAGLSISGLIFAPSNLQSVLTRPPESSSPANLQLAGPLIGTTGALLVAAAGLLVVGGYGARRGLSSKYDAPTGRRAPRTERAAAPVAAHSADASPVAAADAAAQWWKALDAGEDPT